MAEYLVHLEILNSMRSQLCCISWGCLDLLRPGEFEPDQNYVASWKYFCEGECRGFWR